MENNDMENKIIRTQDENGEIFSFELIDVVEFNGQQYGLLVHVDEEGEEETKPASESEEDEDEEEVVIMRLNKENDGYVFETIEDDEEFNSLIEFIESEEDEDDEEDDDDE